MGSGAEWGKEQVQLMQFFPEKSSALSNNKIE
jgi:hypothetical protein